MIVFPVKNVLVDRFYLSSVCAMPSSKNNKKRKYKLHPPDILN